MSLMNISYTGNTILSMLLIIPCLGAVLLFLIPAERVKLARGFAIFIAGLTFVGSLFLVVFFKSDKHIIQFAERFDWLPSLGVRYIVGIDGLSLWLVVLTTLLMLLVLIAAIRVDKKVRAYLGCMLMLEVGMLGTFFALDGITFYVFWELMLVPMYFLIGVWGGSRRLYAAIKFVLYTAFGSLLMLVAIVYLAHAHYEQFNEFSFFFGDWTKLKLSHREELWLFGAFALAFAIKIPLFPFHTWLPDAHVEAPTGGSVILAGVLLKMGLYGLIRIGFPVFPYATEFYSPVFAILGVVGIVYGALVAWVQTDMKKLVAYSSVSHLGFCVLGYASLNLEGLQGCILQMLNHGVSTAALFFVVGVLYERKHTRLIEDYGGLAAKLPIFSAVFLVFTLSSIGLPLTNGFVGEFLILYGGFKFDYVLGAIAVSGVVLGAIYMLSLYRRVVFGPLDNEKNGDLSDLSLGEIIVFSPLLVLVFYIGLYPQPILSRIEPTSISSLAELSRNKPSRVLPSGLSHAQFARSNVRDKDITLKDAP